MFEIESDEGVIKADFAMDSCETCNIQVSRLLENSNEYSFIPAIIGSNCPQSLFL